MALILVYGALSESTKTELEPWTPVFWLEALAVVAFGIAWLVKGRILQGLARLRARLRSQIPTP